MMPRLAAGELAQDVADVLARLRVGAPVGSSASTITVVGESAGDRDALRWPPESWLGRFELWPARPEVAGSRRSRLRRAPALEPAEAAHRHHHVVGAENSFSRKWNWNTKPSLARRVGESVPVEAAGVSAVEQQPA